MAGLDHRRGRCARALGQLFLREAPGPPERPDVRGKSSVVVSFGSHSNTLTIISTKLSTNTNVREQIGEASSC